MIRLLGDEVVGGIVSGFGSIIGSAINARSQERQNKANLKAQQEENERSRQFTEDMYNKYESPAAQRQQMLEAGLNPMGAISPQSVGSASTSALPPGQAPEFGSAVQQGIQAFFDAGTTIRAQRLQDQEIQAKKLENWKTAFENGNAQALFEAQLANIRAQTAFTRQQKRVKRQEEKALILEYKKAKEAFEAGINEYVDESNESQARTANFAAQTAATSDANKRAQELHSLNKQLLNHQISSAEYISNMQKNESEFSDIKAQIRADLDVDFDNLPQWLQADCLAIINCERNLRNLSVGEPGSDSWFQRNKALRELSRLKVDFQDALERYGFISEYDYSYSNRKSEDTKSANNVNQSTWDREEQQRDFDNHMKKLQVITNIANALLGS